jgi:hypothetical protein
VSKAGERGLVLQVRSRVRGDHRLGTVHQHRYDRPRRGSPFLQRWPDCHPVCLASYGAKSQGY